MSQRKPSPETTLVILLGASKWPHSTLHDSQAFKRSATKISDYFRHPGPFGLPSENWLDLFDQYQDSANDVDKAIGSFLDQRILHLQKARTPASDLLFYYIGHGVFANNQTYFLAIQSTRDDNIGSSSFAMAALAHTLKQKARQLRRIVILDCCFSAQAFISMQSAPDQAALKQTQSAFEEQSKGSGFPTKGTALLCSSGHKNPSLIMPDESGTMFSEALVHALSQGKTSQPDKTHLSLYDLKKLTIDMLETLVRSGAPKPEVHSPDQSEGDVASVPFFPVRASTTTTPPAPEPRLSRRTALIGLVVGVVGASVVGGFLLQAGHTSSPPITTTSTRVAPVTADPIPTSSRTSTPTTHPTSSASPTSTTASTQFGSTPVNTYRGHTGQVNAVAWSRGQTYIVSGSNDGTTQVWKRDASKAFLTFYGNHTVWGVAWSPNSQYVAAASDDGMVRVWDILSETQTPLITWKHNAAVTAVAAVAWSPNGKYIATGGYDSTVQVHPWPNTTAKPYIYTKHASPVFAVAWSPDGTKIASADNTYHIHVWEPLSGNDIISYTDADVVNSVDWSSDGQYLASGSNDNNNSFTLNVRQPSNPDPNITVFQKQVGDVHSVKWSPPMHTNLLAVVGQGMFVQVWNPLGKVTTTYRPKSHNLSHYVYVASVDWSPDGNYIISGGSDSLVDVWSAK